MSPAPVHSPAPVVSLTCTASRWLACLFLLLPLASVAHDSIPPVDTMKTAFFSPAPPPARWPDFPYNKKRVRWVAAANIAGYGATMAGLYAAWYSQYPQGRFHTFNDIGEWQQIDKIGHVFSTYAAGKASMEMWRWTGIDRKKRIWIGGLSGTAYAMIIETLDGFSTEWGWSWGDVGANLLGSGLLISQELAWDEQKIQMKFSAHRRSYSDPVLNARTRDLFGKGTAERLLKDYNGQTYWLSTGIKTIFPNARVPQWLQISVGTGAEGMFGARDNTDKDALGNISFDRRDIPRFRQWYLAPDIDLSKIKTKKKGVRVLLTMLNVFKFPTPALEYGNGRFRWRWLLF